MEANNSFKTYVGTKTVKATPMGAADAKRCGANITDETIIKNCGVAGYLMEYEDGYRSWSPAKTFEGVYRIAETHVDRMKIELNELNERLCKAISALCNEESSLQANPVLEPLWGSLREQVNIMLAYADILRTRIRQMVGYEIRISKKGGENGTVD